MVNKVFYISSSLSLSLSCSSSSSKEQVAQCLLLHGYDGNTVIGSDVNETARSKATSLVIGNLVYWQAPTHTNHTPMYNAHSSADSLLSHLPRRTDVLTFQIPSVRSCRHAAHAIIVTFTGLTQTVTYRSRGREVDGAISAIKKNTGARVSFRLPSKS